jgi:uncharacterized membrane protein YfcA
VIAVVLGALAVGLSLGFLGSGGSILAVPVFTYLLHQDEKTAITGALFVVGAAALAGALAAARTGAVDLRHAALFGGPGMAGTWVGARLAAPVPGALQLTVFGLVALTAAVLMIRPPVHARDRPARRPTPKLAGDGFAVGALTGFVGVGGGFLIVPALVLLGGLEIPLAVGTSLAIIAANATVGFATHLAELHAQGRTLDAATLAVVAAVGVAGSLGGRALGPRVSAVRHRRLFGVFLALVALFVLGRSLVRLTGG